MSSRELALRAGGAPATEPDRYAGAVPAGTATVVVGDVVDSAHVDVVDDFVVPVEDRIGEEGDGFKIIMRTLQPGRVGVAGKALGVAGALAPPVFGVGFGLAQGARTVMGVKEAAVDEDDLPASRKTQVRLPGEVFAMKAIAELSPIAF